jgi:hypothetical protein
VVVAANQDKPYGPAVERLHEIATRAATINPGLHMEVFIHKVDGDQFVSQDRKTGAWCPFARAWAGGRGGRGPCGPVQALGLVLLGGLHAPWPKWGRVTPTCEGSVAPVYPLQRARACAVSVL